ncbi:MAG: ATP-dependent helicase RhlE [Thermoplasmata archaeon]|jgi:superfamily II DNA/RNA helicase|nr:ATP-dependent helicase RhlE [Thermoplasmata archaeon]
MSGFETLRLPPPIRAALDAMGYVEPTPVQREAIPVLLKGKDALVEAQTGSGKTAAFGVACVQVGAAAPGLRVVVLVPTRELARQVADEIRALGAGSPFRCVAVTGGVLEEREDRALGGDVRCVVATPGRLLALREQGKLGLDRVALAVVDEADRMLDMGFAPDVERALDAMPAREQTVLVSATLPKEVRALASRHLKSPVEVRVGEAPIPASLAHHRLNVFPDQKERALVALLKQENPQRAIVFFRMRHRAASFAKVLKEAGFAADALQGEMSHDQRRHVFDLFARGITHILVATDLASRGLDVPEMELVVNVDLPDEDEQYLHRAGRAARAGRPGKVISFVLPNEKERREELERVAGHAFEPYRLTIPEADPASQPPKRGPPKRRG